MKKHRVSTPIFSTCAAPENSDGIPAFTCGMVCARRKAGYTEHGHPAWKERAPVRLHSKQ